MKYITGNYPMKAHHNQNIKQPMGFLDSLNQEALKSDYTDIYETLDEIKQDELIYTVLINILNIMIVSISIFLVWLIWSI